MKRSASAAISAGWSARSRTASPWRRSTSASPKSPGRNAVPKTLIRNGTIVNAHQSVKADVLIDGEKIYALGSFPDEAADRIIDATGMLVIPGGVDAHTHLDMPF